jgi:hypothetical protein
MKMYRENFERDLFILSIKVNASNQILYSPDDLSMDIISDSTILYEYDNMIID